MRKSKFIQIVLITVSIAFSGYGCSSTTTQERFEMGYQADIEPPEHSYDTTNVRTISGRIDELESLIYEKDIVSVNITVTGADGKHYFVQVAPKWYLETNRITFTSGESVIVTGSFTSLIDEEEEEEEEEEELQGEGAISAVIIAREIRKRGKTLFLRNKQGEPLWYRRGMIRGRQLYIQKYINDKKAGRETQGTIPRGIPTNIDPNIFSPPPVPYDRN